MFFKEFEIEAKKFWKFKYWGCTAKKQKNKQKTNLPSPQEEQKQTESEIF